MTEPAGEDVRIIGRYALHQEIAAGGMATVHLGRLLGPAGFSRTVAVKRLHAQYAKDPEFVSMFLDEARVAARIRHPNVVSTLDIVALEGEIFIVMDYVEGESLARLIRTARARGERVPTPIVLAVMTNVLYGLHGAHEAKGERGEPLGIVHRDVSPQNILVDTQGIARMVDFGVAKAVGRLQTTRDGQLKGKLAYMAPEQLRGAKVDARTDVFAAGIVLWELLTGERLFQSDNEASTFGKILECNVAAPSTFGAESSPELDAIVLKGLAARPDDRWETALDMSEALERTTRDRPTQREIGRWVRTLAAETLNRRALQVRELESHSAVSRLVGPANPAALQASAAGSSPVAAPDPAPPVVAAGPAPPVVAPAPKPPVAAPRPAPVAPTGPTPDVSSPAVQVVPRPPAWVSALAEPASQPIPEAPRPDVPSHDSVAPTRVIEDLSRTGSMADGELGRPESPVSWPGIAAVSQAAAALPREEPSGSSQVSSIALERAKTAPPPAGDRRRKNAMLAAAIAFGGVTLLGLVALAIALGRGSKDETPSVDVEGLPASTSDKAPASWGARATSAVAPSPKPPEPARTEPPSTPPASPPSDSAKPATEEPKPKEASKPEASAKPALGTATKPKPLGRPGCNPPYTIDKDGTRIPKLECL